MAGSLVLLSAKVASFTCDYDVLSASCSVCTVALSLTVKHVGHECDHSSPSILCIINKWSDVHSLWTPACHDFCPGRNGKIKLMIFVQKMKAADFSETAVPVWSASSRCKLLRKSVNYSGDFNFHHCL